MPPQYQLDSNGNFAPVPVIQGEDGREIQLRVTSDYIQWRYIDLEWQNLIALSELVGSQGVPGNNGKEIALRVVDNQVQWRLGTDAWQWLADMSMFTSLTFVEPETLAENTNATVTNLGTNQNAIIRLGIPVGKTGSGIPPGGTDNQVIKRVGTESSVWIDPKDLIITSTEASSLTNIISDDSVGTIVGKLRKWFTTAAAGILSQTTVSGVLAFLGLALTANKTVYVSTSGSDTTGDGSIGNPYALPQKAIDSLPKNINGFIATVSLANGTYSGTVLAKGFYGGRIRINGTSETLTIVSSSITFEQCTDAHIGTLKIAGIPSGSAITGTFSNINIASNINIDHIDKSKNGITVLDSIMRISPSATVNVSNSNTVLECIRSDAFIHSALAGTNNNYGLFADAGHITGKTVTLTAGTGQVKSNGGQIDLS